MIAQNIVTAADVKQLELDYKNSLEVDLKDSRKEEKTIITPFMADEWEGLSLAKAKKMKEVVDTKVDEKMLTEVATTITTLPADKKFLRKIEKLIGDRRRMYFESDAMDWAMGELLAYGTLLKEGFDVRISGQDVERGTFSHRHALLKAEESEEEIVLLNTISPENQGKFSVYNSLLSEYAVLGFDYGFAMASPNALTIWEAQFGDFSNGAQIVIDQYIASGEDKWKTQNGIVLLLPHGYEGQGAEHSSARIERYLQLCAKDNMFVANCSTPANLFHILRRQMKTNYRKPLVIFTPKSLLRHQDVVSSKEEFANGKFHTLIEDADVVPEKTKTLVFCSGKFYYDLVKAREEKNRHDVAIVRVEQLFPLPIDEMRDVLEQYKDVKDVAWAQEEPRNMGVWSHLLLHLPEAAHFRPVSRRFYAAPAAGSATRFKKRHGEVIDYVFDDTKNNFIRKNK